MTTDTVTPSRRKPQGPDAAAGGTQRTRGQRIRRGIAWTALGLVLVAGGTGWWMYHRLDSNLSAVDLNKALGEDRPEKLPSSGTNLLILGSDSRAGANGELAGGSSGGLSDTTLMVHIPEGRQQAVVVSIPRDTLITRPECQKKDGTVLASRERVMFNSLLPQAGPGCVVKTVEKMSGVRMDHYIEVDFAGFKNLVDAIGGVHITLKEPIRHGASGLNLAAGPQKLNGTQALGFVRTRLGVGDGSDLGRISNQQMFLTALLSEVKQQDLLGSPAKTFEIADAATKSMTTDSELASLTSLATFARSMKGVDPNSMETIMLPVAYDKADPNRVVAAEPQASTLWKALREGTKIPDSAKKSPATGG
ncbi:LCP family protein [Streptomyces sp. MS1.HAVA.3]|uniref:LCP family protein n=1 Tax=Streptomyces caledonius TaxID=3134107 RepID=A0ABU8U836_9ACTN